MKKLTALLVAAVFSLSAALPASAASNAGNLELVPAADESVAVVPAAKPVKSAKKHKQIRKAKHKQVRKAKHKRAKARAHKRQRQH